jgi:hypothetical protein
MDSSWTFLYHEFLALATTQIMLLAFCMIMISGNPGIHQERPSARQSFSHFVRSHLKTYEIEYGPNHFRPTTDVLSILRLPVDEHCGWEVHLLKSDWRTLALRSRKWPPEHRWERETLFSFASGDLCFLGLFRSGKHRFPVSFAGHELPCGDVLSVRVYTQ